MAKIKFQFKSREQEDTQYTTAEHHDGVFTCTCPGWMFQAGKALNEGKKVKTSELCKHVKRLKEVSDARKKGILAPRKDVDEYKNRK